MHLCEQYCRQCADTIVAESHCSADLEYLLIKCRPFYLPQKYTSIVITAVYVPPDANTKLAMQVLHAAVASNEQHIQVGRSLLWAISVIPTLQLYSPSFGKTSPASPEEVESWITCIQILHFTPPPWTIGLYLPLPAPQLHIIRQTCETFSEDGESLA